MRGRGDVLEALRRLVIPEAAPVTRATPGNSVMAPYLELGIKKITDQNPGKLDLGMRRKYRFMEDDGRQLQIFGRAQSRTEIR
jgi:hypothetical protein